MNPLTRWNRIRWTQLNELEDLQHSLRSLFSRSRSRRHGPEEQVRVAQWIPLVSVSEDAAGYALRAELPRVKPEDVKIALEDGTLTITGDRKFDKNGKKDRRVEHAYGRFAHNFVLPADARPAKIRSVFKHGVLTVHLTKNGCSLAAARVRAALFPETQTAKKNENENETAIIPR
jgi:HSP20 family protein